MLKKISSSQAPKQVVNAIVTLYNQGKIADIIDRAPKILEAYPNTYILYNILGVIYFQKGLNQEAANYFGKSIDLIPNDPYAYNNLGNIYKEEKNYKEAIHNYESAINIEPNYFTAYENLFSVFQLNNDISKSEKLIKKAIERLNTLSKKNAVIWKDWVAMCLHEIAEIHESNKDWAKAKKNYNRAIQIKKKLHTVY